MNYENASRVKNAKEWAWDDRFVAPDRHQPASEEQYEVILRLSGELGRTDVTFPVAAVDARIEVERLLRLVETKQRMGL
jgi:hypothetical protein